MAALPGVRDVAVVGVEPAPTSACTRSWSTEPGVDPQSLVRQANQALLDHQKIRGISVWPGQELPRTEGTRKLKRQQVRDWVASGSTAPTTAAHGSGVEALLAQFAHGRAIAGATTLDELGLSSLERVELMVALEERFGRTIDESAFARATDVAALEQLVRAEPAPRAPTTRQTPSRWTSPRGTGRGGRAPCAASATRRGCCRWRGSSRG